MAKLTVRNSGHPNLDGDYELDLAGGFTKTEYSLMKKQVGVVVGDMTPGAPLDVNVMTAWGIVALRRSGKEHLIPIYMDTTDEQTEWSFDEEEVAEDEELPPVSAPRSENASDSGASESDSEKSEPSGTPIGNGSGDSQAIAPSPIGIQP